VNTIEGKRTLYVTITLAGCLAIICVAGMLTKVLDGPQITSLVEWGIPWIGGIFGVGKGIEVVKTKVKNGSAG